MDATVTGTWLRSVMRTRASKILRHRGRHELDADDGDGGSYQRLRLGKQGLLALLPEVEDD